jgi:ribosome biogenesis ATPase
MIGPVMVRPGRLDKLLYVDLPGLNEKAEIVRTMVRKAIKRYPRARARVKIG